MADLEGVTFRSQLEALMAESPYRLGVSSGRRSTERQQQLWDQALAKYGDPEIADNWVARPGTSNHETGNAVDLDYFDNPEAVAWVHANAARFGLHFPLDNEDWHIEPIDSAGGEHSHGTEGSVSYDVQTAGAQRSPEDELAFRLTDVMRLITGGVGVNAATPAGMMDQGTSSPPLQDQNAPVGAAVMDRPMGVAGPEGIDAFMAALSGQESGGDYNEVNEDSGAAGRYQIMPDNWPSWSQEAGLGPNAPRTPRNQEIVARHKLTAYYNEFGDWRDVAVAWYSGPDDVAGKRHSTRRQGGGKYPSISEYADQVMARMGA